MNIIAIDPGKMTGFAETDGQTFDSWQLDHMESMDYLYERLMLHADRPSLIVWESFIVTAATAKMSQQPWSLKQIGFYEWICTRLGILHREQTPAQAKSFSTDEKLKLMEWYRPNLNHGNDAARHLLLAGVQHNLVDIKQLLQREDS